jgi:putative copper resistance protein D
VAQFLDLFGFLSVLFRGLTLVFEAMLAGGVIFLLGVARGEDVDARLRRLIRWSAIVLGIVQVFYVFANSAILSETTGLSWGEVAGAQFFRAGVVSVIASLLGVALNGRALILPALLAIAGSLLTSHASARLDDRGKLIAITALHHLATAAWIGGLPYLWIGLARSRDPKEIAQRFSRLATVSVAVLGLTGLQLSVFYVGSVAAAYGTTYGLMVGAKVLLFAVLLLLGLENHQLVKKLHEVAAAGLLRLRRVAEAEIGIGLSVVLAAASLTSMPPAGDLPDSRVSLQEIAERLTPHAPRIHTPPLAALSPPSPIGNPLDRPLASYVPGETPPNPSNAADIAWSEYNHHWSGYIVILAGVLAMMASFGIGWARHWPLAFIGLAIFLFLRADAENWPLGARGFWESFAVAEVAQHRLFVVLIVLFACFEWAVRNGRLQKHWAALVFPAICAFGGALLLTHTHSLGNIKEEMLAELSHVPLAIFGLIAGWARWLELRLPDARLRYVWPLCLTIVGVVLVLYREA